MTGFPYHKVHYTSLPFRLLILTDLLYSGEKKPHMWSDEFKRKFMNAFDVINKDEECQVYSNKTRIRNTNGKVKANFWSILKGVMR